MIRSAYVDGKEGKSAPGPERVRTSLSLALVRRASSTSLRQKTSAEGRADDGAGQRAKKRGGGYWDNLATATFRLSTVARRLFRLLVVVIGHGVPLTEVNRCISEVGVRQ